MLQNYFTVDGKRYYTGTVFTLNAWEGTTEASFICYNTENSRYYYQIKGKMWIVPASDFKKRFISVTEKMDPRVHMPIAKTMKDRDIDGLFIGWLWYVFLMGISVIFKDAIGLFILISVVFFSWRNKKIKKEGTYIEW